MTLSELVGQETAATVLANAIRRQQVAHAYLFVGPDGVGKRTAALAFAQALNCLQPPAPGEACQACPACAAIEAGSHPDVRLITPAGKLPPDAPAELLDALGEAATITLDQIRHRPDQPRQTPPPLLQDAYLRPHSGRRKVYLVDPADRLHAEAANSLLHLLEEPPPEVSLVLITSRLASLLPTIISRCQQVQFHLAAPAAVAALLEARGVEAGRAALLARLSGGRPGWALTAWRRPETLATRERMLDFLQGLASQEPKSLLRSTAELKALAMATWSQEVEAEVAPDEDEEPPEGEAKPKLSRDRMLRMRLPQLLELAMGWYRDVLAWQSGAVELVVNTDREQGIAAEAARLEPEQVARVLAALEQTRRYLQRNANVDLALEGMLLRMAAAQGSG